MFKNKLIITIISAIFLISCLCISICAYDYTSSQPYIDGYTVVTSEFSTISSNFYSNSFSYHFCEYSQGSLRITTYEFVINFMLFQSDFTDNYYDFGYWLDNNGIEEVTPLSWKNYILSTDTAINDIYITINSSDVAYGNIENTLNSYSNCAYLLYYIANLEEDMESNVSEMERIITEYNNLYTQYGELEAENTELEAQVGELSSSNQILSNNYDTLNQAYGELEAENTELEARVGELSSSNQILANNYDTLNQAYGELEAENTELEAQVGELSSSNQILANNYDTLYQAYGELELENASLREQLDSDVGYEEGYNQALNDTSAFKKGILFIMSSPVVIFSNMFNYDIFGINAFNIIQVLFTVLVVSFAFGLIFKYIL